MKFVLNEAEQKTYDTCIVSKLPTLHGIFFFKDFFPNQATSARIGRKFREDVTSNLFPNVKLVGTLAREGYIIE